MNSDFQSYLIRSLLSEGRIRYETIEKTREGMKPRLIEREGPTGLIVTTTAVRLHPENETRMISLTVTDTNEQTRDVMAALAKETIEDSPDLALWHALQAWLENAEHRVTIPYAKELARLVPPVSVWLRRDFGVVLNLIRAHVVLHQASRERDEQGRIVATLEDYAAVRDLVADLVSEGIEATVPATVRETVEAVARLHTEQPVSLTQLAQELKLDKSAALRRARTAIDRGYLKNLEDRRGRPARLVPADSLPDDLEILPAVARLQGCGVGGRDRDKVFPAAPPAQDKKGSETSSETVASMQPLREEPHDGTNKRVGSTPSDNGATLQPLTVEDASREMTRFGSKAFYGRERYREEPTSSQLGRLTKAVLAAKGIPVNDWREYEHIVEGATKRLANEEKEIRSNYDQMVEERIASLSTLFDKESRPQADKESVRAVYVGSGPMDGIAGKAYPRESGQYWFQPDTGAMSICVEAEDLEFSKVRSPGVGS
jgi:hypothetical protein